MSAIARRAGGFVKVIRLWSAALAAAVVGGCSGGGSAPTPTPTPSPTPTVAALPVTLSATSTNVSVDEGQGASFAFTASYTGTSSTPIVADVQMGSRRIELNGTPVASGTSFNVPLRLAPLPPGGTSANTVTFRLCTSSACSTVYPGSTQTFTVNLDVRMKDWATFQRDAGHTGYVAANYTASEFGTASAWSISSASPNSPSEIAARRGRVFFNLRESTGNLVTRAVNSVSGAALWSYDHGRNYNHFSGPSYSNGRVVSMVMNTPSTSVPMQIINADSGAALGVASYGSQFSNGGVPTPVGDNLYFQAGYFGDVVYAANAASGGQLWARDTMQPLEGNVSEGESVAVDENHVYFFSGGNLFALNRNSGTIAYKIRNPYFRGFGLGFRGVYRGAPILGRNGRIITFVNDRIPQYADALIAFSLSSATPLWRSAATYLGQPALRDDTLFAIRADGRTIDMINMIDGTVSGSIDLGSSRGSLVSNIVVTGSHLFVASDTATYAIDLQQSTYPVVWTAAQGGTLAITPDSMLVISASNGVYAYKLTS